MNRYTLQLRNMDDDVVLNGYEICFPGKPPKILLVDNIPYLRKFEISAYPLSSDAIIATIGYTQSDIGILHLPKEK